MQLTEIKLIYDHGEVINVKPEDLQLVPAENEGKSFTALVARGNILITGFHAMITEPI